MKKIVLMIMVITLFMSTEIFAQNEENFAVYCSEIKNKTQDTEINIATPYFEGFAVADEMNHRIKNIVANEIGEANAAAFGLKQYNEERRKNGEADAQVSLMTNYDYSQSGNILSIRLNTYSYTGGAHGMSWVTAITANTGSNEIYALKDLFKEGINYNEILTNKIIEAMQNTPDLYFPEAVETIRNKNGNFQYYIDGKQLVIYFDLYDIAPYVAGIQKFAFDIADFEGLLKDEVLTQFVNAKEMGNFRLNGSDVSALYDAAVKNDVVMLPARQIAEALGYTISWSEENGAGIAGGFIKEGVNAYSANGNPSRELPTAPVIMDGVSYVPIDYFTDVLNENVSYDGKVVRLFKQTKDAGNFDKQIINFRNPTDADECVKMFAEAMKNREGAVQYALCTDELKAKTYEDFKGFDFVTGASSPWISGYEMNKTSDNQYTITLHWASSTGAERDSTTTVTVAQNGEYWQIQSF